MSTHYTSPTIRPGRVYAGVVIGLPEPVGRELRDWRASFGDPAGEAVPAHITLLIAPRWHSWDTLVTHVRDVASCWEPFHVEIKGTGTFRPVTPVVYLRVEDGYRQCVQLHEQLNAAELANASPFELHPHVTLAHAVTDEDLDRAQEMLRTYHASFLVDRIDLYEGDEHGSWHVREHIPFAHRDRD